MEERILGQGTHDKTFASSNQTARSVSVALILMLISCTEVATAFSTTHDRAVHAVSFLESKVWLKDTCNRRRQSSLVVSATLATETGQSSAFSPDDDDDEEEDEHDDDLSVLGMTSEPSDATGSGGDLTSSTGKKMVRSSREQNKNPAMADTGFLRKRTADILRHANTDNDPSSASLSSRGMKVERKTFNFLFDAWAFSGEVDAAEQATRLLECMEELGNTDPSIKPDVRSYTKVINAISRSASMSAGDDAERILDKMKTLFKNGYFAVKPNTHTYTAVMEAHANSCLPGSAERAEQLCEKMVKKSLSGDNDVRPTARAFNAVIHAYAKLGNAAKAEAAFNRMEALYEEGIKDLKPAAFNYNALISAWANCGEEGSAHIAEEVLERMESMHKAGDENVKPTTVSFNAVIDAYAKSGEDDAAEKAEDLLTRMGEIYESGENTDARPNARSFNSVINAWAKSPSLDAALKAEGLLDLMNKLYYDGNKAVRPDVHSFCTVINAWARSSTPGKADRAYNLYRQMKKLYEAGNKHLRPNVVAINAVMNACAYTMGDFQEQNRAMEIAHKVLKECDSLSHVSADQVTYGTFLKVCRNQMPDSHTRQQIVEALFKKACKDGQVGNFVLYQLKSLLNADAFREVVGKSLYDEIQMEDLPKEWWCNVVEGKWRRKRLN